jgi:hypothetical protein
VGGTRLAPSPLGGVQGRGRLRTGLEVVLRRPVMTTIVVALVIRVAVAVAAVVSVGVPVFGDDALYHEMAADVVNGAEGGWSPYRHSVYELTKALVWPVSLVYRVVGIHALAGALLVVVFGTVTAAFTAALAQMIGGRRSALVAGGIVALLPSQVLWSSLLLKDALVWAFAAGLGLVVARSRQGRPRTLLLFAVASCGVLYVLAHVRFHTVTIVACALVVAMAVVSTERAKHVGVVAAVGIVVPLLLGLGPFGLRTVYEPSYSPGERRYFNAKGAETALVETYDPSTLPGQGTTPGQGTPGQGGRAGGGGGNGGEEPTGTTSTTAQDPPTEAVEEADLIEEGLGADLVYLPRGLEVMLLEPVPWSADLSTGQLKLAKVESLLWYPVLLLALVGITQVWRRREVLAYPCLVAAATAVAYGLSEGNFGTAYRHRGELVWPAALLAAVGVEVIIAGWSRRRGRPSANVVASDET